VTLLEEVWEFSFLTVVVIQRAGEWGIVVRLVVKRTEEEIASSEVAETQFLEVLDFWVSLVVALAVSEK
jgi:hypothetical protein